MAVATEREYLLFINGESTEASGGELKELYPLPPEILDGRVKDGFTYPVVVYDHDEGRAITGGFAYHGRIDALNGKFVFGDIHNGRVFVSDLAAMKKADGVAVGLRIVVETRRIELPTFALRTRRSPS